MIRPTTTCADCGTRPGQLFLWPFADCPRIKLCSSCSFARQLADEVDRCLAVSAAVEIIRWHGYCLSRAGYNAPPLTGGAQ